MRKENVAFRTSVNGYNKKDVYNYIEAVDKDIKTRSDTYEHKISSLESEKTSLESKLSVKDEENNLLKARISGLEKDIVEKESLIEELDRATVKISVELDELAVRYAELVSKYKRSFCSAESISELERKADAYDKIVARAKEKKQERTKFSTTKASVHSNEKDDIDNILTGSAQEVLEHIKMAQIKFSEAIENAQKESEILRERVDAVMSSSKKKILSQINDN